MKISLHGFALHGFFASVVLLTGCASLSVPDYGSIRPEVAQKMIAEREAEIANEPRGGHYIGRRYVVNRVRIWGYLRKPGQPWSTAQLVVFNENRHRLPDRVKEFGGGENGKTFGYDHNREYKINGYFTGRDIYDPNADAIVPEFTLTGYTVLKKKGGYLFSPGQRYDPMKFPSPQ